MVAPRPAGTLLRVPAPLQGFDTDGPPPAVGLRRRGEWGRGGVSPQDEARPPGTTETSPHAPSRGDTPARPHGPTCTDKPALSAPPTAEAQARTFSLAGV
ncbi:hypothetical protein GCM10010205_15370 [Streptomyces nojiriensis]|nr:hypothetical protein GCM10010205_15370 [Streptomyces nojiriensis]